MLVTGLHITRDGMTRTSLRESEAWPMFRQRSVCRDELLIACSKSHRSFLFCTACVPQLASYHVQASWPQKPSYTSVP